MKRLMFSVFALLVSLATGETLPKPNIVFMMADDLGYGDLGCYGCQDIKTPHLDRLAREGIRMTDFYANGPICSPTRMAFVTGRYQQRYGIENALSYQEMGRGVPIGEETVAGILRKAGYATGLSGKWHLGYDRERQPLQQGFDEFFGLLGGNHHYFEHMDRIGVPDLWLGNEAVEREGYSTDLVTEHAVNFIEKHRKGPFFLYLAHPAPHFPFQGPNDREKIVKPKTRSWQQGDRATYVAMVERMDEGIGKVLAKLDERKLSDNTLVVFTSDNGGDVHSRNTPMRGFKGSLWEGGIRVPCVVRWPAGLPAGTISKQAGITMDWTATFRKLASGEDDAEADGVDLLPILTGKEQERKRTLFWRRKDGPARKARHHGRAVRDGRWKLIEHAKGDRELFDLWEDVGEKKNLYSEKSELAKKLSGFLDAWEGAMEASYAGREK